MVEIIIFIVIITIIILFICKVLDYYTSKSTQCKYTVEEYKNLLELAKDYDASSYGISYVNFHISGRTIYFFQDCEVQIDSGFWSEKKFFPKNFITFLVCKHLFKKFHKEMTSKHSNLQSEIDEIYEEMEV